MVGRMSLADRLRRLGARLPSAPTTGDAAAPDLPRAGEDAVDHWFALNGLFAWEADTKGRILRARGVAFGWPVARLVGLRVTDLLLEPDRERAAALVQPASRVDMPLLWARAADGQAVAVRAVAEPVADGAGGAIVVRGVLRDVGEERATLAALADARQREARVAGVVRALHDGVDPSEMLPAGAPAVAAALDASGVALFSHDGAGFRPRGRFGQVLDTAAARDLLARLAQDPEPVTAEIAGRRALALGTRYRDQVNGAILAWRRSDEPAWRDQDRHCARDIAVQVAIAIAQGRHHEELQRISATDLLTGLFNRRMFFQSLRLGLARADNRGVAAAMGYVDLDNFKSVNDVHGHHKGDIALQRVADLLRANTSQDDLVARLGGDEFAVFLADRDEAAASAWGAVMMTAAKALIPLSGAPDKPLGLSVGLVIYTPGSGETLDQLTHRADEAMYSAKRAGKGRVRVDRRA
jgi:diguanylate cyclase (GGDEF)-like protein